MALNKDWRNYPDTSTPIDAAALEDLEARVQAEIDAAILTASGQTVVSLGSMGASQSINLSGRVFVKAYGTLTANCTVDIVNPAVQHHVVLVVTQDATGSRTLTVQDNGGATTAVNVDPAVSAVTVIDIDHNGSNLVVRSSYDDSDIEAISALATTSFGRSLLTLADASALAALAGTSGGVGFPLTSLLDDFNRANGGLGASWNTIKLGSAPQISSNAVVPFSAGAWSGGVTVAASYGPNVEAYCDLTTIPSGWQVGLVLNWDNAAGNGVQAFANSTGVTVERVTASAGTVLTSDSETFSAGDGLGFKRTGTTLSVYRRSSGVWSLVTSTTDSTYATAGRIGFWMEDGGTNTVKIDNFSGGTV